MFNFFNYFFTTLKQACRKCILLIQNLVKQLYYTYFSLNLTFLALNRTGMFDETVGWGTALPTYSPFFLPATTDFQY